MLVLSAAQLRQSALALVSTAADIAAHAQGGTLRAGTSEATIADLALGLRSGSDAVRSLKGPFMERIADTIADHATRFETGRPLLGDAIRDANEGARWLLGRSMYVA